MFSDRDGIGSPLGGVLGGLCTPILLTKSSENVCLLIIVSFIVELGVIVSQGININWVIYSYDALGKRPLGV